MGKVAAANTPAPLTFPIGGPDVNGNQVTVDLLAEQPTRITRTINDLALTRFFVDRLLVIGGEVTGGAVLYDQATQNELYLTRDVQRVEPGEEFPIVTQDRGAPRTAQVEKFGGKFPITDEAKKRNNLVTINNAIRRLANTIQRKMQQRALAEIAAAVAEHSRFATSVSWADALSLTDATRTRGSEPGAVFAAAQREADENELGYRYNILILNPQEEEALITYYGPDKVDDVLKGYGITDRFSTPRQAAGTALMAAEKQVGEMRLEEPLGQETWRDKDGREQDWYQSSIRPVVYVTDPFALLELRGLAA